MLGPACRRTLVALTAVGLAATGAPTAIGGNDQAGLPTNVLRLNFNTADYSGTQPKFPNVGAAQLAISVATADGGSIRKAKARVKHRINKAIRTPRHDPTADAPRAVVRVVDRQGADDLNPGTGRFTFGADFVLAPVSETHTAASTDNGNNLVQRGLFNQVSQYKIQLDGTVVSCRIKGSAGIALVTSSMQIATGRWYRVRCERDENLVTLSVTRWRPNGTPVTASSVVSVRTGDLSPAVSTVPLSIGGKLNNAGEVLLNTDQFNGRIDNVLLRTLPPR